VDDNVLGMGMGGLGVGEGGARVGELVPPAGNDHRACRPLTDD